ncbi:MAG: pseudouridine synthase [Pseudobdellovibrionaceae bacterium]
MSKVRLNRFLAQAGIASRRSADRLIADGSISINGKKVYELGIKVDPNVDKISLDGRLVHNVTKKIYLAFNKPKDVLSTMSNETDSRAHIGDYCAHLPTRVFSVGRLDWDSEGLIILTNDGDLANKIMHPSKEITKTYLVKVNGKPEEKHIQKLRTGVSIIGGKVSAKHIERIKLKDGSEKYDWFKIIITEGKNRQSRLMFEKIGFDVMKLQRVAIGRLRLGTLDRGDMKDLTDLDLKKIFQADDPEELKVKKSAYRRKPLVAARQKKAKKQLKKINFDTLK